MEEKQQFPSYSAFYMFTFLEYCREFKVLISSGELLVKSVVLINSAVKLHAVASIRVSINLIAALNCSFCVLFLAFRLSNWHRRLLVGHCWTRIYLH